MVMWVLVATIYWTQTLCFTYILFSPDQTTFQTRFYYPPVKMKEVMLGELELRHLHSFGIKHLPRSMGYFLKPRYFTRC